MSFAELVSEMTDVCFSDAGVGEAATYTAPTEGAVAVNVRAVIDEPTENPFSRELPRSAFRERSTSVWIWRTDTAGNPVTVAARGVLVITTSHGVVRTVELVSPLATDPDRVQWNVREASA